MKYCKKCSIIVEDGLFICPKCKGELSKTSLEPSELKQINARAERIREYEERLKNVSQHEIDAHVLTTGYTFQGFTITRYCGIVANQVIMGTAFMSDFTASVADFFGSESNAYGDAMKEAREAVLKRIIVDSIARGGNAVIGIDFDYTVFGGNIIGVSVSGTSVYIKERE